MPELPEVETIARGLAKRVTGDVIESVWLGQKKEPLKSPAQNCRHPGTKPHRRRPPDWQAHRLRPGQDHVERAPSPAKSRRAIESRSGKSSRRHRPRQARKQWRTRVLAPHEASPVDRPPRHDRPPAVCEPQTEIAKHTHAILKLASGRELRFVDPRRFGRLSVAQSGDFDAAGIEPLEVDLDRFLALFRGRKTPIKSALLNQKLLRGVGNIYADESLFRAGIRPRRRASTITRDQLAKLLATVKEVLKEAIALGGSSISDYVDADGEEGFFQLQHRVYGREGEPCLVCKSPIKRIVIAGRSSHYCPKCQK